jgi:selenocysteine lyase/cysteine desulfurase
MLEVTQLRAEMPITRQYNFMDHAAVGPISGRAGAAMRRFIEEAESHAYARGGLYPESKRVRQLAGKLLNCHSEELTFVKNTSEGLSFVANGLSWSKGG